MSTTDAFPGLNCGLCGFQSCNSLAVRVAAQPEMAKRCIHVENGRSAGVHSVTASGATNGLAAGAGNGTACAASPGTAGRSAPGSAWQDSLGREYDFVLRHFPEDPGPREIIIPHNPLITREMDIQVGDVLVGRPLGMSCGCPITHCGQVMQVDHRTGVLTWCVTGPLRPRAEGFKDLGYYIAEAYEGLIKEARCDIQIGMRYFFQPEMCMLQWRHSGLVNYVNRTDGQIQVRVEGLWIG